MNQEILNPVHNELGRPNELNKLHDKSFEKQNKDEQIDQEDEIPLPNFAFSNVDKNNQGPLKTITSGAAEFDAPSKNENSLDLQNEPGQNKTLGKVLNVAAVVENHQDEVFEIPEEVTHQNDLPSYRVAATSLANTHQHPHGKHQETTEGAIDSAAIQINIVEDSRSQADVPNRLPPNNAVHIMGSIQENRRQASMNRSSPRRTHTNQRRRQQRGSNSIEHQLEELDLEGWVDADVDEESEEAVAELMINRRLENVYQRKLTVLSIGATVFVLLYLISLDLFAFEIITLVLAVFYAIGAFFVGSKLSKEDFVKIKRRWRAVVLLDWIFLCQYAIFITLKLHGDLSYKLSLHTIPGYMGMILLFGIAEPPPSVKNVMIISRGLLWTQLLLISLKLDDSVSYNWNVAFVLVWIVLISLLIALGASVMVFFYLLSRSIRGDRFPSNMPINFQLLNTGMNIALLAIAIICTVIISAYSDYLEESGENLGILQSATLAGAIYTLILATLLIGSKKPIKKFLRNDWVSNQSTIRRTQKRRRVVSFKSVNVKQSEYFVQMSPTYFLIFEEAIYLPGKESIQRMKQYMMNVRDRGKAQKKVEQQQTMTTKVTLETLRSMGGKTERTREHLSTKLNASMDSPSPVKTGDVQFDFNTEEKLALSFDDREAIGNFTNLRKAAYNPDKGQDDGENLCFICYEKNADSVFMNCGHGGVCFDCAQETWRKRSKCVTCREVIREILRVAPIKGSSDFVRSLSVTTKTYEFNDN